MRASAFTLCGVAIALAATGCSAGSPITPTASVPVTATASMGAAGLESVTVHGSDQLMFSPMSINAKVGTLEVTFVNDGTIAHTFRVKGVEPDTGNVNGHQTAKISIVLSRPGTYYIQCDYHPTMVGTLVVTS